MEIVEIMEVVKIKGINIQSPYKCGYNVKSQNNEVTMTKKSIVAAENLQ